jgi:hypothetical protein
MIAAIFLLAALQGATAPPAETIPQDPEIMLPVPIRMTPIAAARAFEAFRSICMATFPDPAAFDAAAAASDLGFARSEASDRRTQEWNSAHGQIAFRLPAEPDRATGREGRGPRRPWIARCDFWVAIAEPMTTTELVSAIGGQLLAGRIRPTEEIIGFAWDLGTTPAGVRLRLLYLPASEDSRLFTLSLQQLPGEPPR